MDTQLRLINGSDDADGRTGHGWRLSDETRLIGRRGIALARQELRRAKAPDPDDEGDDGDHGHPTAA